MTRLMSESPWTRVSEDLHVLGTLTEYVYVVYDALSKGRQ